jgi:hypothetical protein
MLVTRNLFHHVEQESNFSLQAKETAAHIFIFVIIYIIFLCMCNCASHVYSVYCSYSCWLYGGCSTVYLGTKSFILASLFFFQDYRFSIMWSGYKITCGTGGYDKEEKAARAYDLAALKYWGANATTNYPVSDGLLCFISCLYWHSGETGINKLWWENIENHFRHWHMACRYQFSWINVLFFRLALKSTWSQVVSAKGQKCIVILGKSISCLATL